MRVQQQLRDGVLMLTVSEKALVRHPDWEQIDGLRHQEAVVVALDLQGVDFVSSLFLVGCVELQRALAEDGRHLVLLHLARPHRALLELIDGGQALQVLENEDRLHTMAAACVARRSAGAEEGVTLREKRTLWES